MKISDVVNILDTLDGSYDSRIYRTMIIELGKFALGTYGDILVYRMEIELLMEDCDRLRAELDDANGVIR